MRIGTSGYSYPHWKGKFYPDKLPSDRWLNFYAQHFNTVELNVTFYRLPHEKTFANWYENTPPEFSFGMKGSRFITHIKGLKQAEEPVANFFERAGRLADKLGVLLWQLPPALPVDLALLSNFCAVLEDEQVARHTRHAFEFRHPSWLNSQVYGILKTHGYTLCMADPSPAHLPEAVAFDFAYLRFHGSQGASRPRYSVEELRIWAERIGDWLGRGLDVYAYFNNDIDALAIANARELIDLVGKTTYSGRHPANNMPIT